MPTILHCIETTGPGGAETIFVELAERFSQAPYTSLALIRGPGWVQDQLTERGVQTIVDDSRGSINVGYLARLIGHLRRHRVDLVHAHLPGANLYSAMAGLATGTPVLATFHGSVDLSSPGRLDGLRRMLIRRGASVVAVSEGLRRDLSHWLGVRTESIELVLNGINFERFAEARPSDLRDRLGVSPETRLIGSLGNIRPAKAYDVGLRAIGRLLDLGVDACWVVAGQARLGDALLDDLEALAEELGVADRVRFLGFVDEPERFLADLDAFLLCSSSEGHPLALIQAMAKGLPIVATRSGVESVLGNGAYAWLAEVGDAEMLAQHLSEVLTGNATVAEKQHSAQRFVREHFDRRAVWKHYELLYQRLIPMVNIS